MNYKAVWKPLPGSQSLALSCPCNEILFEGTRGPGKTAAQLARFRRNVGVGYGSFWRGVIFDTEYKNLADIITQSKRMFRLFNDGARYLSSASELRWVWPTGEELLFRFGKEADDYWDFHGQEFPFIGFNELTKQQSPEFYEMMFSCRRSSFRPENYPLENGKLLRPIPLETFSTTNPFGIGHTWVKKRFIEPAPRGTVQRDRQMVFNPQTEREEEITLTRVAIHGSFKENPYLDPQYIATLMSIKDPNRRKAWVDGSWDVTSGGRFDHLWNDALHVIKPFRIPDSWTVDRSHDWGESKPFSNLWWAQADGTAAELPDGRQFCPPAGTFAMGALFLLSYYTDVAGVGAAAAGTMLLLVRVFDAFADVFAGRVVDSVNTRWGKFRPFLLFGTAPLMIFSVLVFWVPTDWSHGSKVVYAYLTYMGLGLCYSLVNIPYGSLATAMTQQPQSRARLGAARGIAASLTFVCLAFLIGPSIKNSSPEEMVSVYHFWTIVLAIAGMVLYFICFKSTRENVVRIVAQPSLNISLQTLKRNRPLFMLCIGALCVLISTFAVSASSLFYVRYVLNDTGLFTVLVLVQNLVGTVASAPLVPGMVARIGKKNTFLIGALLGTCGYLLFFWVSVWSLPVALVALAIASIGQGVTMTVMWALEADTVEYGEYLTGVRIEGLTYSLFSFTRKCGQAIGGSIPAFILGLSGYIANQVQTPEVIMGIRTSIALVPCGFMLLAFVIIWFYPLTDKKFKEIVVEIDNRKKVQQQLISDITN